MESAGRPLNERISIGYLQYQGEPRRPTRRAVWELTNPILKWTIGMGLYGLVSGVGFGGVLSLREGRRTIFEVSLRRAARWGVVGSAAVPLLFGALGTFAVGTTTVEVLGAILVTGVLEGTFAPAAIVIAQRAELRAAEESRLLSR